MKYIIHPLKKVRWRTVDITNIRKPLYIKGIQKGPLFNIFNGPILMFVIIRNYQKNNLKILIIQ